MFHAGKSSPSQSRSSTMMYKCRTLTGSASSTSSTRPTRRPSLVNDNESNGRHPSRLSSAFSARTRFTSSSSSSWSSFRPAGNVSLDELVLQGAWTFRAAIDDTRRSRLMGVEHLVALCHDIMRTTRESIKIRRQRSRFSVQQEPFVVPAQVHRLIESDGASLRQENIVHLLTIVYEAASTNASISQLTRIWREASVKHCPSSSSSTWISIIGSHESAIRHLLRTPDDRLLEIAVHAALISGHSRIELQRLGDRLGVGRSQFDVASIKDSSVAFKQFVKVLRERTLQSNREQQRVNIKKLPYKPRKKRGLNANVVGTKFAVGQSSNVRQGSNGVSIRRLSISI
jgi:hypothetical protein